MTLGLLAGATSLPAYAQKLDTEMSFDAFFKMADKNKDNMMTRQEFVDAMGKVYDMKMEKAKAAKDAKMMKGDAMTREGMKSLFNEVNSGA
jgi:hypothetical protein